MAAVAYAVNTSISCVKDGVKFYATTLSADNNLLGLKKGTPGFWTADTTASYVSLDDCWLTPQCFVRRMHALMCLYFYGEGKIIDSLDFSARMLPSKTNSSYYQYISIVGDFSFCSLHFDIIVPRGNVSSGGDIIVRDAGAFGAYKNIAQFTSPMPKDAESRKAIILTANAESNIIGIRKNDAWRPSQSLVEGRV